MTGALRRLGLVVNPVAGRGPERNLAIAALAIAALAPEVVVTGPGPLGAAALSAAVAGNRARPRVTTVRTGRPSGRAQTSALVRRIIGVEPDAIVVIGGDGTLADVAAVCLEQATDVPVLGVGVGSTNVGPLVTVAAEEVQRLVGARFARQACDALVVRCGAATLGVAFHDIVVGFTVVGTLDGVRLDLDAAARVRGATVPGHPQPVGGLATRIVRSGPGREVVVASGEDVGGIAVAQAAKSVVRLDRDPAARAAGALNPALLLASERPRLIDEWQLVKDVWNEVRGDVDDHPEETGRYILTGSAVPEDDETRHTGSLRFTRVRTRPMSLAESGHSSKAVSQVLTAQVLGPPSGLFLM